MTKEEMYALMNANLGFYLATADGDQPRVRGMMLFRADDNGIVFHTASTKDVFRQITANPKAELCWNADGVQIRVTGRLEVVNDPALREEIFAHPTRKFLQAWKDNGIDDLLQVLVMRNCEATTWTMATNFAPKETVRLCCGASEEN